MISSAPKSNEERLKALNEKVRNLDLYAHWWGFGDYCNVGPTRVPFVHFPPEQVEKAKRRAAYWMKLCEKYRPLVEAERGHRVA